MPKRILVLSAVLLIAFIGISQCFAADVPMFPNIEKQVVLDLLPGPDNPRNSEGAFLPLKNGNILFVYTRYVGDSDQDHAPASLVARISTDQGKTWSHDDREIVSNEGGMNVMSVSLVRFLSGDIGLFYLRKNSFQDCRPFLRTSKDEGETWSGPVACITDEIGYYVLNNDRVLQRKDGSLLLPVALHANQAGQFQAKADIFCYASTNQGKTWTRISQVPNPTNIVLQEPGIVELAEERLLMFIRSNAGHQCYSFSDDGGKTWSPVESSPLISPMSPALIKSIPNSKDFVAVWNKDKAKRNPMNIAILDSTGKTIKKAWTLDFSEDDSHWFCYPAVQFLDDNTLLIGYCAGDRKIVGLNATRIVLQYRTE